MKRPDLFRFVSELPDEGLGRNTEADANDPVHLLHHLTSAGYRRSCQEQTKMATGNHINYILAGEKG